MVKLSGRFSDHTWMVIKYALGIAAVIFFVFPIFWLFKASFNKPIDAVVLPPVWLFKPEVKNYIDIFVEEPFLKYLRNSVLISGGATLLAILIGFPAAYAFARADFRFKKDLAFWILSIFMFPPLASILPMLILFKHLRLVDTVPGIILAHLTFLLPLSVWLLQRFIRVRVFGMRTFNLSNLSKSASGVGLVIVTTIKLNQTFPLWQLRPPGIFFLFP
jgi:multiple sugar transport system permease protein